MPHKRSLKGKIIQRQREQDFEAIKVQRKAAWQFIRESEFRDRLIGETICRTDINTITDELAKLLGQPESEAVPNVEQSRSHVKFKRECKPNIPRHFPIRLTYELYFY